MNEVGAEHVPSVEEARTRTLVSDPALSDACPSVSVAAKTELPEVTEPIVENTPDERIATPSVTVAPAIRRDATMSTLDVMLDEEEMGPPVATEPDVDINP